MDYWAANGIGHINGISPGDRFASRAALVAANLHRESQKGIWGAPRVGAKSIVLSDGYEDDQDLGDVILYTGEGGQNPSTRRQEADQSFATNGNKSLVRSCLSGAPVRVIRGPSARSRYAPVHGFRYDGLFVVTDYFETRGTAGFRMCRYVLRALEHCTAVTSAANAAVATVPWIPHRSPAAARITDLYAHECQVCGVAIRGPIGAYAEAAHLRPISYPHNGPDATENVICVCPNHHVEFTRGFFAIASDFSLIGRAVGNLRVRKQHQLSQQHLEYHRRRFGYG